MYDGNVNTADVRAAGVDILNVRVWNNGLFAVSSDWSTDAPCFIVGLTSDLHNRKYKTNKSSKYQRNR